MLRTRKEAGRTWEVLVGWQWWPLKTSCSWWPVWGSGSGGCSRSWHTFLVCQRLVCHSPFKKWISFLYLRLGRLPPWPSWEDVKASMAECFNANYPDTFIVLDATDAQMQSCAPKLIAVWPCSRSFILLTRAAQRWRTSLDWYFPEWLNLLCQWVEWIHQRSLVIKSIMFCLSKKFYHHIHKQCYLSTFFFLLSDFLHLLLLIRMIAWQATCFVF